MFCFFINNFIFNYVYMGRVCTGVYKGQKMVLDPLGLELQRVVNYPVWVLETKQPQQKYFKTRLW